MSAIYPYLKFWFNAEFFSVGLSAFIGVAIRVAIVNVFNGGGPYGSGVANPAANFGPFMQLFYTQSFLIPNFLGCFLMAVFVTHTKSISDVSVPLFKFLTTGLCGCITTFSSWAVGALFQPFELSWYEILIMIMLEFWLTWGAFTAGYAIAKMPTDFKGQLSYANCCDICIFNALMCNCFRPLKKAENDGESASEETFGQKGFAEELEEDIVLNPVASRVSVWREDGIKSLKRPARFTAIQNNYNMEWDGTLADEFRLTNTGGNIRGTTTTRPLSHPSNNVPFTKPSSPPETSPMHSPSVEVAMAATPSDDMQTKSPKNARFSIQAVASGKAPDPETGLPKASIADTVVLSKYDNFILTFKEWEWYFWFSLFTLVALILWWILVFQPSTPNYADPTTREMYRAVALGPLGAWCRWGITRFPQVKAMWPEMNPQTILANMIAVLFITLVVVFGPNWSWAGAVDDGFNGSCSTVSTFFAEINTLYYEKGPFAALRYTMATFILAIIIVQVIRGGAAPSGYPN